MRKEGDSSAKKAPAPSLYKGSGYTLSSGSQATNVKAGVVSKEPQEEELPMVERRLTFWRNGFSIDDGDLLDYNDPKHQRFLELIKSG